MEINDQEVWEFIAKAGYCSSLAVATISLLIIILDGTQF